MREKHEGKLPTRNVPIREYTADTVCILMGMHLGAPSIPCVQKGEYVKLGQIIGQPCGGLGLPVHASVSGEVIDVAPTLQLNGPPMMAVTIRNDHRDDWADDIRPLGDVESVDAQAIVPAIKAAGICGMGGAAFPTHIKLTPCEGQYCDTVILNGAECETYLTSDYRLMLESPSKVVDGLRAAMRALSATRGVIAIEDNKPEAIASMCEATAGRTGVEVMTLKTKYPQGGEKQLIQAVTGREVPQRKLPIEVNVIVINVGTAAAIADAVTEGKPLISRITTMTGCVRQPSNLRVRIGTAFADAVAACGGYVEQPGKLIAGGGMTGLCAPDDTVSITKATNGVIAYTQAESAFFEETPCIRCARCVMVCPSGLRPYLMKPYCDAADYEKAKDYDVLDCIVCGCCSYACPAHLQLASSFKNAKDMLALARKRG